MIIPRTNTPKFSEIVETSRDTPVSKPVHFQGVEYTGYFSSHTGWFGMEFTTLVLTRLLNGVGKG